MSRYVVQAGWQDVPHLTDQDIEDLSRSIAPHQREARMNGTPSLGAGAIYPVGGGCGHRAVPDPGVVSAYLWA